MITLQKLEADLPEVDYNLLKLAVSMTLSKFNQPKADVTIRLTSDEEMKQLNQTYRRVSSPTDVLSFNQDFMDPETGRIYLGDIVISLEMVAEQAPKYNLTIDQECAFLAIHGALHLLGFDHNQSEEKDEMWNIQDKIFKETIKEFQETLQ